MDGVTEILHVYNNIIWGNTASGNGADVHLAGSGPTLFTLLRDDVKANAIHKKLQEKGLEAYLAEF